MEKTLKSKLFNFCKLVSTRYACDASGTQIRSVPPTRGSKLVGTALGVYPQINLVVVQRNSLHVKSDRSKIPNDCFQF